VSRGLQRERIVQRALELADQEGLDAVSFRRLAADFGVTPMALYRHVADRDDLLAAMHDRVLAEIKVPEQSDDDWVRALRDVLQSSVTAYTRHPAARRLSYLGLWSPGSLALTQRLVRLLTDAGFDEREGMVIIQRLSDAALGEVWSTPGHPPPDVPALDADARQAAFEDPRMFGIDVVLAGARALADQRAAASTSLDRPHTEAPPAGVDPRPPAAGPPSRHPGRRRGATP
jgi:AcrR family transcriptional regulator